MGDLAFGQPLGLLDNIQYSPWVSSVFNSVKILLVVQIIEFYPLLRWLFDRCEPRVLTDMKTEHWNHTVERVDRRLERGPGHPDIWSLVMEREGEGEGGKLTVGEMHTNAELFMLAGSETTGELSSRLFLLTSVLVGRYVLMLHSCSNRTYRNSIPFIDESREDGQID